MKILKEFSKKHDTSMSFHIAAMVLIFVVIAAGMLWTILYFTGWRNFKEQLLEDIGYASAHQSLFVTVDGEPVEAAEDGGSKMMSILAGDVGIGKRQKKAEVSAEKGIYIDFGNNHQLYIVKSKIDMGDNRTRTGILITYVQDGKITYCYDADRLAYYSDLSLAVRQ